MVSVQRKPKEQLVERQMADAPKCCLQNFVGRSVCVLPGTDGNN